MPWLLIAIGSTALCCAQLGVHARHDDSRDEFAALCVGAGLSVEVEQSLDNLRPADVLVHSVKNSPAPSAVDFFGGASFATFCGFGGGAPRKDGTPDEVRIQMPVCQSLVGRSAQARVVKKCSTSGSFLFRNTP